MYITTLYEKNHRSEAVDLYDLIFNLEFEKATKVYVTNELNDWAHKDFIRLQQYNLDKRIEGLVSYLNYAHSKALEFLENNDPNKSYKTFKIPKASGGYRTINEPKEPLKEIQKEYMHTLSHIAFPTQYAYAYTKDRDVVEMAEVHKNAKFIIKMDFKHFFDSVDKEILVNKLKDNYIFNKIEEEIPGFIETLAKISLLDNKLPQGSPISPLLCNLVMIEFDVLFKQKIKAVYTRYADDIILSAQGFISVKNILEEANSILKDKYYGKININPEKTKVLTPQQRCYIVGVKLNKDNKLTYGHEKKKALKLELYNLFKAKEYNVLDREQAQEVLGRLSFMYQIEPNYTNYLIKKYAKQFNVPEGVTIHKFFLGKY